MENDETNGAEISCKIPVGYRILGFVHGLERTLSESVYRFWCRIKGGKFERKAPSRPNACLLVTKRGSHLTATLVLFLASVWRPFGKLFSAFEKAYFPASSRSIVFGLVDLDLLELEVYELNCPEAASYGQGQKQHAYAFQKKDNCVMCGRCFEARETDKKIVGSFYEN